MVKDVGERCQSGDTFVLFFAGHGMSVADDDGDEEDGTDEALCFTENGVLNTKAALTDDTLASLLTRVLRPEVNVVLFMDCCHSGTVGDLDKQCWAGRQAVGMYACQDYQESADTGASGMLTGMVLETLAPAKYAPENSSTAAIRTARRRVRAPEPTLVAMALATSLAPMFQAM